MAREFVGLSSNENDEANKDKRQKTDVVKAISGNFVNVYIRVSLEFTLNFLITFTQLKISRLLMAVEVENYFATARSFM